MTVESSKEARWRIYMLAGQCTQRQVKEAVFLADKLKDGPFDPDGFEKNWRGSERLLHTSFPKRPLDCADDCIYK
jgi:hypothetical protein